MYKKRHNLRLLVLVYVLLFSELPVFADSFRQYVGESFILPIPSDPSPDAEIHSFAYSCSSTNVKITNKGLTNPSEAVITSFFSGSVVIECFYSYVTYFNGNPQGHNGSYYHTLYCQSNDISISAPKNKLRTGETMQMTYNLAHTTYGLTPEIKWKSSSNSVSINGSGKVTAKYAGKATISASSNFGENVAKYEITVKDIDPTTVVIPSNQTVYVGETSQIQATLYPSDAETELSWYSTNTAIATVRNGAIEGKEEGKTTIYCISSNGVHSNECEVNVFYRTATGIQISSSTISVPIGEEKIIPWTLIPSNARALVTWRSKDSSIASISQSGIVTGNKQGKTTVFAKTENGYETSCHIEVPPNPDKISLPNKVSLYLGQKRALNVTTIPTGAYAKCKWQSSDPKVAEVNSNGTVTALHPGRTVITATSQNGKTGTCTLEVPEPSYTLYLWTIPGEKISFFFSENPKVKAKDGSLFIESQKTDLHIPTKNLLKFTMADAHTNELPSSIETPSRLTLAYNECATIGCTLYPLDYDIETSIQWESTDDRIATVTTEGCVYGRHPGECEIIATASNGRTSSCHVAVLGHDAFLVLWARSGEKVTFDLGNSPRIKHENGKYIVSSKEGEVSYPDTEIRKLTLDRTIEDDTSGMNEAFADQKFGAFTMSNARAGSKVLLYSEKGILLDTIFVDTNGNLQYSIEKRPTGIYLLKTESTTIKILKK